MLGEFPEFLTLPAYELPRLKQETPGATQAEHKERASPLPDALVPRFAAVVGESYAIRKPEQLRTYESDALASFRVTPERGGAAGEHRGGASVRADRAGGGAAHRRAGIRDRPVGRCAPGAAAAC